MKKKIVVGGLVALGIIVLVGGFAMMKKTVARERFDLSKISEIALCADAADVQIQLTDAAEMTVTQYAKKKVPSDFAFTAKADGSTLAITDNGQEVSWLFGIKGSAGISYELKLPISYAQNLSVRLQNGNMVYSGAEGCNLKALSVDVAQRGNLNLSALCVTEASMLLTGGGNIAVSLTPGADCMVTGETASGNVSIAPQWNSGKTALSLKSNQGNITVK